MKKCTHTWRGHENGVTCMRCGLELTAEEYAEFLKPKEPEPKDEKKDKQGEQEQPKKDNPEQEQPKSDDTKKDQEGTKDE